MLTIDTTGKISWGQPDWERIYNSPNNTKSIDELIKQCRSELTEMHLYDLQEKVNISEGCNLPICEKSCQYRGLCCDKDNPDIRGCVGTMRGIITENGNYDPVFFKKKISKTRLKQLIKAGLSLEKCEVRDTTNGEQCSIYGNNGCGGCKYYAVESSRQIKEYRSKLKRQDITQKTVAQFKELHEKAIDTDYWVSSYCEKYCPYYGVICESENPDTTKCMEQAEEILKENEKKKNMKSEKITKETLQKEYEQTRANDKSIEYTTKVSIFESPEYLIQKMKETRANTDKKDITLDMMIEFKKLHDFIDYGYDGICSEDLCPYYGIICDKNNRDKNSCVEKGFEIGLENERRKK